MKVGENEAIRRWREAYGPQTHGLRESSMAREPVDKGREAPSGGALECDQVSLSRFSQELQKVKKALEADPGLREERIAALRQLIASGEYDVPDEQLAERIVQHFLGER